VYTTCLYCAAELGANDVIEHQQVGRRLAFDAAQGRLWVVCTLCARWNLVPFEQRLEAIDDCERHFRMARARFSILVRLHGLGARGAHHFVVDQKMHHAAEVVMASHVDDEVQVLFEIGVRRGHEG
jgi:hypothetical protein